MGRTQKATKNIVTGLVNKAALMLLAFVTKTAFIRLLGAEYNGVSSLYTNILSVLALAELGVGNVLMFYLYAALERKNEEEVSALVYEFKKIYNAIIVCVLAVGLALVPFLQFLVNRNLERSELIIYYLLYLANSVASYFVVYRTTVIRADQSEWILNNVSTASTVVMYILQLTYLYKFRNFLGYLIIQVVCTIANNLIQNYIAVKRYPYLKEKPTHKVDIDKSALIGNVKATFLFKVSDTILDQTDNIIISVMIGTLAVGMYSNYYMLIMYLVNIAGIIANGMVASFGNLYVEGNKEKSYKMLRVSMLLFSFYGTICGVCYICLIQDFIPIWVGKQYLMEYDLVFAVVAVFYLRMVTNTIWIYRSSMGLFKEVQYINIAAAVLNIILSIALEHRGGLAGIIIATAISRLLTSFWYEAKVVFEKLERPVSEYFKIQAKDLLIASCIIGICYFVTSHIHTSGLIGLFIKVFVCLVISGCAECMAHHKEKEFEFFLNKIQQIGKR